MEMWKMLTQKFRAQSLDEMQPFQHTEVEDRDSGTESDEENAELQAIEDAMQHRKDQENMPQVSNSYPPARGYHYTGSELLQMPQRSSSSPQPSLSKRPLQLVNQTVVPFQPLSQNTGFTQPYNTHLRSDSPQENSDYERCSLDYEPTSSIEYERHSSEEELTIINCAKHDLYPEKRKWSQVNRCNSCDDSSGSSDEEIRDLLGEPKPLNFSSSPPHGVQRLSRTLSPRLFLASLAPNNVRLCAVSPRKRHRQMTDIGDSVIQRPCLDFEKMQKTLFRKHMIPHGITKARFVKIRKTLFRKHMIPHGITKARFVKIRVGLLKEAM